MGNYASKGESYTKPESDTKYQVKGNYAISGTSYTKPELDGKYALLGSGYTKQESDNKYAVIGSSYTKQESDAKYPLLADFNTSKTQMTASLTDRYTKGEVDTKLTGLISTNQVTELKSKVMWCADGALCTVPAGKSVRLNEGLLSFHPNAELSMDMPNIVGGKFNVKPNGTVNIPAGDVNISKNLNVNGAIGNKDSSTFISGFGGYNVGYFSTSGTLIANQTNTLGRDGLVIKNGDIVMGANQRFCNADKTACFKLSDIVTTTNKYSIEQHTGRGALQAADAWDARTSNNPAGDWERWVFNFRDKR